MCNRELIFNSIEFVIGKNWLAYVLVLASDLLCSHHLSSVLVHFYLSKQPPMLCEQYEDFLWVVYAIELHHWLLAGPQALRCRFLQPSSEYFQTVQLVR
jgi:hypothetical protein